MVAAACAVGRLGADGPWLGFAPSLDDGYDLVVAGPTGAHRSAAAADDLLSLAIAYFEDALDEPPEELAATHADVAALVRYVAAREPNPSRAAALAEAVDAIDDGLAADAVIGALVRCLAPGVDAITLLERRAAEAEQASAPS
jgi:hypothetical protein